MDRALFAYEHLFVLVHFVKNSVFNMKIPFLKTNPIYVDLFLCSVYFPFIYMTILIQIPHYSDSYNFILVLKLPNARYPFFFFQNCFGYLGSSHFHKNCKMCLQLSKNSFNLDDIKPIDHFETIEVIRILSLWFLNIAYLSTNLGLLELILCLNFKSTHI